jgi:hypothetical protein
MSFLEKMSEQERNNRPTTNIVGQRMTIKAVAIALNVSRELIVKKVREFFPYLLVKGKTTYLNEGQVQKIKNNILENPHLVRSYEVVTRLDKQKTIRLAIEYLNEEIVDLKKENMDLKKEKIILSVENQVKEKKLGLLMADKEKHFTSTQVGAEVGLSAVALNQLLKKLGFIFYKSGTWTAGYKIKDKNYLVGKEKVTPQGDTYYHNYFTEEGRLWILQNIDDWRNK